MFLLKLIIAFQKFNLTTGVDIGDKAGVKSKKLLPFF